MKQRRLFVNTQGLVFFFQGNFCVLPGEIQDNQIDRGVPLDLIQKNFDNTDSFEIPAQDSDERIRGLSIAPDSPLPPGWRTVPVRQSLSLLTAGLVEGKGAVGHLLRAFHVAQWRRESQFCGSCGTKNTDAPAELARRCPSCGRMEFPRISPAVITIILNDKGQALLAHNKNFAPGLYSLIAGFNEAGESLEATVARETKEEVNIEVGDIRYIASQPWPFPNSLMLGFTARYVSGTVLPDGIEIEDAQWFGKDDLPALPGNGSVSRYLISRWLEGSL
jgi:NAD+ diphosphatase